MREAASECTADPAWLPQRSAANSATTALDACPALILRLARTARLALHVLLGLALARGFLREPFGPFRRAVVRWWSGRVLRILRVRVSVQGEPVAGAALQVANHISWLDIPALAAYGGARFLSKREVRDWPAIGYLTARAGTIYIERGSGVSLRTVLAAMSRRLAMGEPMLMFPESTCTDGSDLAPFHAGLFQAAIAAQVPVQPVALTYRCAAGMDPVAPFLGEDAFVPHLWRLLRRARPELHIDFLPPLATAGRSRAELAAQAHAAIRLRRAEQFGKPAVGPKHAAGLPARRPVLTAEAPQRRRTRPVPRAQKVGA